MAQLTAGDEILRQVKLASDTPYEPVSLENSDFNWRALLKSMPGAQWIIGRGVVAFNFRLLPDVMDQNGVRWESGERHVFEVVRADGSSVLLHFHKNGKFDPPEVVPSQNVAATPAAVSEHDGVEYSCRPAMQYNDIKDKVDAGDTSAPLGAAEEQPLVQGIRRPRHRARVCCTLV